MARFKMNEESRTLYLARALYDAVEDCNIQQVNTLLVQNKANPNILIQEEGMTPFHLGAGHENLAFGKVVTRLFLHNNGDPNVRCDGNRTVLHIAVAWNRSAVVEILLKSPYIVPNPYIKDDDDLNVFNYAVKFNSWESLATLQSYLKRSDYSNNSNNCASKKLQSERYVEKDNSISIKEQKIKKKLLELEAFFDTSDSSDHHNSYESLNDCINMMKHESNSQKNNVPIESYTDTFSDILNKKISSEYIDDAKQSTFIKEQKTGKSLDVESICNTSVNSDYNNSDESINDCTNKILIKHDSISQKNNLARESCSDKFSNILNKNILFEYNDGTKQSTFIKKQKTGKPLDLKLIFNISDSNDYNNSDESLNDCTNKILIKHDSISQKNNLARESYSDKFSNILNKNISFEYNNGAKQSTFSKEQKTGKPLDLKSMFNISDSNDYNNSDESLNDCTNKILIKHDSISQKNNLAEESCSDTFSNILNKNISSEHYDTKQQSSDILNKHISSEYNDTRQSSDISLNNYFDVLTSILSTNDKFESLENISFPFDNLFEDATENILSQPKSINTRNDEFMTDVSGLSSFLGSDDYFTCSDMHTEQLHKINNNINLKIEDITNNTSMLSFQDNSKSTSISKVFTETDEMESSNYESTSPDTSSLSDIEEDYDTDFIRQSLRIYGHPPGPLVPSTKRLYIRKLNRIIKDKTAITNNDTHINKLWGLYSSQLNHVLIVDEFDTWKMTIKTWSALEESIISPKSGSSFTYLLLDPRITKNLPVRANQISSIEIWQTFISSIFYIGKGTKSRPYSHMNDAFNAWIEKNNNKLSHKEEYILNIWKEKMGVVCLQAFHNLAMEEALVRESCMIDAIGLNNLTNIKRGTYASTMRMTFSDRCKLGCYLLYRAMHIFLADGERQLKPIDLT